MIHYQYKFLGVIRILCNLRRKNSFNEDFFFSGEKQKFRLSQRFWSTTGYVATILGDPGADKGGEGKSKQAEKYVWNQEK